MKIKLCIILYALLASQIKVALPPSSDNNVPSHLNVNIYLSNNLQGGSVKLVSTSQQLTPATASISEKCNALKEQFSEQFSHLNSSQLFKKCLIAIPLIVAVSTYSYLFYIIYRGNNFLKSSHNWASWRSDIALEQLLEISQDDLSQQLLNEIHRRYPNQNITDIIGPFTSFTNALELEKELLSNYIYIIEWLDYMHMIKLFPITNKNYKKAIEQLQRVTYLQNVFKTWASHYMGNKLHRNVWMKSTDDLSDVAFLMNVRSYFS